jgi:hypothetical protein
MVKTKQHLYIPHIILNSCSILLIGIGLYFSIMKPDGWFKRHRACMIAATVLLFCSIFYALLVKEYTIKTTATTGTPTIHSHLGIVIGILLLIQIYIAITHRKQLGEKYKMIHRSIAILLISCIIAQIYFGYKEYRSLRQTNM